MASSLALRSQTFPIPFLSPSTRIPRKLSFLPLFSTLSSTVTLSLTPGSDPSLPYGPSFRKGRKPPPSTTPTSDEESDVSIDKESFSRAFDLAALRVPAEHCFSLESRLRGHLLNWPRVRNVARVPGDEIDPDVKKLLRDSGSEEGSEGRLDSLARRVSGRSDSEGEAPSPVLYRDKLVKAFNCRGYVKFRNLAKISRPKKKRKGEERKGFEARERRGKSGFAVVEVVGDGDEEKDDLSGLLGEGFGGGRWRGSTRLLLLDERYAEKGMEELPEAVKVVLEGGDITSSRPLLTELVHCRLTLFYDYWPMNEILEALLPEGMVVPTAFETVGHIAHLNLRDEHLPYKKLIAQVVLDKNKPKIQTVVNKIDAIQNNYRTMKLEVLAGNHSLVTTVVENGIRFHIDLGTVYWNSRLATERQRLISSFTSNDVVCDVFAGVGPIAISAAKKVKHVYANDLNPNAVEYLETNVVLNKVDRKIEVFNMDGRRFISSMLASQRPLSITQVVMNLPNNAADFLDAFRGVFKRRPKEMCHVMPKVHVYGFSKAQVPEFDFHERINMGLCQSVVDLEIHRVRLVAPGKWMLCGSFVLPETVAFGK